MTATERLAELDLAARYHRERLALYRARTYGGRPISLSHLRELERSAAAADERLRHARDTLD